MGSLQGHQTRQVSAVAIHTVQAFYYDEYRFILCGAAVQYVSQARIVGMRKPHVVSPAQPQPRR